MTAAGPYEADVDIETQELTLRYDVARGANGGSDAFDIALAVAHWFTEAAARGLVADFGRADGPEIVRIEGDGRLLAVLLTGRIKPRPQQPLMATPPAPPAPSGQPERSEQPAVRAPAFDDEALANLFTYHPPQGPVDVERYQRIREAGRVFAAAIAADSPAGADQSTAIRAVREAVMWANAAIATGSKR